MLKKIKRASSRTQHENVRASEPMISVRHDAVATSVESLEPRRLLSVAYDYTVFAQTGAGGITTIGPNVSINDNAVVAFQGSTANDNGLFAGDGTAAFPVKEVNPGYATGSSTYTQFLQINNSNLIVANERIPGPSSFIQTWNANTGASATIAKGGTFLNTYSSVLFPAVNNTGTVTYAAMKSAVGDNGQYLESSAGGELNLGSPTIQLRMMLADNGALVFRKGNSATSSIMKVNIGLIGPITVANSATYSALGQSPGISDDGKVIAFYGVDANGPGIFASYTGVAFRVASIQKNAQGQVIGPISAFSADTRVAVNILPVAGTPGFVVFQATGTNGQSGIYSVELQFDPNSTNPGNIAAANPVLVSEVGKTVQGLSGTIQSLSIYDPLNVHGSIAYSVTTSTGVTAVVRADPVRRPVLVVPGVAGSFVANPSHFLGWLMNRGVDPTELKIDPLVSTYDDLVQSFVNQGYVIGKDLFAASYDWRLDPGPAPFPSPTPTGHVSGLTADNITSGPFRYGVDYLGYWLMQAENSWESRFHAPLDSVDIVAHSTGGLVTRTYMESDAYGGTYNNPTYGSITLPKVNDFVMTGVPNRGAGGPLNPLLDNWNSDPANAGFLSKIMYSAYKKVLSGLTVSGPFYNIDLALITGNNGPDLARFIQLYCPTLRDLLGTYPMIDTGAGLLQTVASVPGLAYLNNSLLNNLNGGSDPNAFADLANKVVVVYGMGQDTITTAKQRTGPAQPGERFGDPPDFAALFSMSDGASLNPQGHQPAAGEIWYQDISVPGGGDGTVPLESSVLEFLNDSRFITQGFPVTHTETVSFEPSQRYILQQLGVPITGPISQGLARPAKTVLASTVTSMIMDPVEGFLVDSQGRRLGYSAATGPLAEIPGSVYYGDTNGLGFIFDPVTGPLTLNLTGIGQNYFVQVDSIQANLIGGVDASGFLANGATKQFVIAPKASGIFGTSGNDTIVVKGDGTNTLVWVNHNPATDPADYTVANTGVVTIDSSDGDDNITIDFTGGNPIPAGGLNFSAGGGNDTIGFVGNSSAVGTLNINSGTVTLTSDANGLDINVNGNSIVNFSSIQHLKSLTLNDSSKAILTADGNHFIRTAALTIAPGATLDLANNDLIIQASASTVQATLGIIARQIKTARNTPIRWQGNGITSSNAAADAKGTTGLAVIRNMNSTGGIIYSTLDGESVDLNSVLVKYTYNGDSDLNGKIDANDYFQVDNGFIKASTGYVNGDLDYNGIVDADDYFLIDRAFTSQSGILASVQPGRTSQHRQRLRHHRLRGQNLCAGLLRDKLSKFANRGRYSGIRAFGNPADETTHTSVIGATTALRPTGARS